MRESNLELRKFFAPECVFGADARLLVGSYAQNMGARKALVVTDPGVQEVGWASDVTSCLETAKIPYVVFDHVTSNPRAEEVMEGTEVYMNEGCNCIISVGGGSPIDCAKGIGIVSTNKRHILEFEGVDEVISPVPPLICIPTTGGSSADVSQFAIITDTARRVKIAIISKMIVPDVSLIDPITLTTMPADLTAHTGLDTLTHGFEAYVSNAHSALTDLLALEGVRLITKYLAATIDDPTNVELRSPITAACIDAGMAFSNASLGLVHAMAHSLGGFIDAPHGESNAILLPYVISFNFPAAADRYRALAVAVGLNATLMNDMEVESALIEELIRIQESVGLTARLSAIGVKPDDIPDLAKKAMNDPTVATNPRVPTLRDIEDIYERAL